MIQATAPQSRLKTAVTLPLSCKVFADGAALREVAELRTRYGVCGFTTNPTLMAKAGVRNYWRFARDFLQAADGLPVSFEVFADEFDEMEDQAYRLADLGENVYVKIPVMNTCREPSYDTVSALSLAGVQVNVTAVFTINQIDDLVSCFSDKSLGIISIFAGRIADAGVNPVPTIRHALKQTADKPNVEVLWASCREIFNVAQADRAGCHIVTVPYSVLPKLTCFGKDLTEFSWETVQMFRRDALASGFTL